MGKEIDKGSKSGVTKDGKIELEEDELDKASGGASDYLLAIDGIKGESQDKTLTRSDSTDTVYKTR